MWLHVHSVVTEAQAPHRLSMDFRSLWFTGHLDYDIGPAPGGCLLRQREQLLRRRPARPFRRIVEQRLRPRLQQRLDDIRAIVER